MDMYHRDSEGRTGLHYAAQWGSTRLVARYCRQVARREAVKPREHDIFTVGYCITYRNQTVPYSNYSNPTVTQSETTAGQTPYETCTENGHATCARRLLDYQRARTERLSETVNGHRAKVQ